MIRSGRNFYYGAPADPNAGPALPVHWLIPVAGRRGGGIDRVPSIHESRLFRPPGAGFLQRRREVRSLQSHPPWEFALHVEKSGYVYNCFSRLTYLKFEPDVYRRQAMLNSLAVRN